MADYSNSKLKTRSSGPLDAVDAQDWSRVDHLVTPTELRTRFLFGIPLVSNEKDPITGKRAVMGDDLIKDIITGAVSDAEAALGVDIFPVQREETLPFDRNYFQQWGYIRTNFAPITSVDAIAVKPGTGQVIYQLPLDWVGTGYFRYGQINIIPIMPVTGTNFSLSPAGAGGGAVFLAFLNQLAWIPQFWALTYTTGFPDGAVPRIISDLVGCYAAIDILNQLGATHASSSVSLSLDGGSQSRSSDGTKRFAVRVEALEKRRDTLIGKIRARYGKKFIMSEI